MAAKKQAATVTASAPSNSFVNQVALELSKESLFSFPMQAAMIIAEKMVNEGASAINSFEWFLAADDREEIGASLKKKFNLK